MTSLDTITVEKICQKGHLNNKTVIKYYQQYKAQIKEHNLEVKNWESNLEKLLDECM